jgi:hypothetical protein
VALSTHHSLVEEENCLMVRDGGGRNEDTVPQYTVFLPRIVYPSTSILELSMA